MVQVDQMTLITKIFATGDSVKNDRTPSTALIHLFTEVGELAQEVQIAAGDSYKDAGEDGVIGEAIDVILCAVDIIRQLHPNCTEAELIVIAENKLTKWKQTA